jgi:hypothetical protein
MILSRALDPTCCELYQPYRGSHVQSEAPLGSQASRPSTSSRTPADIQSCAAWKIANRQLQKQERTLASAYKKPLACGGGALEALTVLISFYREKRKIGKGLCVKFIAVQVFSGSWVR